MGAPTFFFRLTFYSYLKNMRVSKFLKLKKPQDYRVLLNRKKSIFRENLNVYINMGI